MKQILIIIFALGALVGCQERGHGELNDLVKKVEQLKQQLAKDQKEYAALKAEVEDFNLDSISFDEDYKKGQEIIEEQDARYNALLNRWEEQADRMDAIILAQEKQFNVKP